MRKSAAGESAPIGDGEGDATGRMIDDPHDASSSAAEAAANGLSIDGYHVPALAPAPEWLLVDGSSAIFRAFYGVPQTFRAPNGFLVNAVRGTLDRLASVITERKPSHVALTTDEDWRPDWRVDLIPGYKAHRVAEPVPPAAHTADAGDHRSPCCGRLRCRRTEGLRGRGHHRVAGRARSRSRSRSGAETATCSASSGTARSPCCTRRRPASRWSTRRRCSAGTAIPGRAYSDFAILRGDPSDGLPGIAGVGPKKAADLVKRYGSIEGMLDAGIFRDSDAEYLERAQRACRP